MKKQFLAIIAITSLIAGGCKKKADEAETITNITQPTLISGGESITKTINKNVQTSVSDTSIGGGFMFFYPECDINVGAYSYDVGEVSVNSVILQKQFPVSNSPFYEDTTNSLTTFPLIINVSGNGNVAPYSYIDNGNWMPSFSNHNLIPTSISKSAGITFTLSNLVNNPLGLEVYIGNSLCTSTNNIISFTPTQLSVTPTSTNTLMRITLKGGNGVQIFNGKNYYCTGEYHYNITGINVTP